jgi:hypothetical protein
MIERRLPEGETSALAHWARSEPAHVLDCPVARAAREWDAALVSRLEL